MPRLLEVADLCSSNLSDTANMLRKTRKKKSSAVPLFSKRSHIGNLRQIRKQGKGRSPKRKGNRRCPFLFASAAGRGTFPPSADGESPLRFSEKLPARKGRTRSRSSCAPVSRCRERSRPVRANTLAQFARPGPPVQKTSLVFKLNCFSDNATAKRHTQVETA